MRFILLVFSICLALGFHPKKNKDLIWDQKRKLEFSDFKAKPNPMSSYQALSAVGIKAEYSYEAGVIKFNVYSFFTPKASWSKDKSDAYILNHEQRHFDISEVNARRLRKAILETNWSSDPKKISKTFGKLFKAHLKKENEDQIEYDETSNHSIIKDQQANWDKKIDQYLKDLSKYKSSVVLIKL